MAYIFPFSLPSCWACSLHFSYCQYWSRRIPVFSRSFVKYLWSVYYVLDSFVSIDNSVSNRETRSLSGKPLRCCCCVCVWGNNEPLEKRMILKIITAHWGARTWTENWMKTIRNDIEMKAENVPGRRSIIRDSDVRKLGILKVKKSKVCWLFCFVLVVC